EHAHLRSRDGRDPLWPRAGGLGRRRGQLAVEGRQVLALLRRDRQEGRREDALENVAERAPSNRRLTAHARPARKSWDAPACLRSSMAARSSRRRRYLAPIAPGCTLPVHETQRLPQFRGPGRRNRRYVTLRRGGGYGAQPKRPVM